MFGDSEILFLGVVVVRQVSGEDKVWFRVWRMVEGVLSFDREVELQDFESLCRVGGEWRIF